MTLCQTHPLNISKLASNALTVISFFGQYASDLIQRYHDVCAKPEISTNDTEFHAFELVSIDKDRKKTFPDVRLSIN